MRGVTDDDGYFGEPIAARYDDPSDDMFQPEAVDPAVDLLAELAGDGAALELGVGTGRIALPLSARARPGWRASSPSPIWSTTRSTI